MGTAATVLLGSLVGAAVLSDFGKPAPGFLRAITVVFLIAGLLAIGFAWVGFNWQAEKLRREVESSSGNVSGAAEGEPQPREEHVSVSQWPAHVEVAWTVGLYLLIACIVSLVAVVVWALN